MPGENFNPKIKQDAQEIKNIAQTQGAQKGLEALRAAYMTAMAHDRNPQDQQDYAKALVQGLGDEAPKIAAAYGENLNIKTGFFTHTSITPQDILEADSKLAYPTGPDGSIVDVTPLNQALGAELIQDANKIANENLRSMAYSDPELAINPIPITEANFRKYVKNADAQDLLKTYSNLQIANIFVANNAELFNILDATKSKALDGKIAHSDIAKACKELEASDGKLGNVQLNPDEVAILHDLNYNWNKEPVSQLHDGRYISMQSLANANHFDNPQSMRNYLAYKQQERMQEAHNTIPIKLHGPIFEPKSSNPVGQNSDTSTQTAPQSDGRTAARPQEASHSGGPEASSAKHNIHPSADTHSAARPYEHPQAHSDAHSASHPAHHLSEYKVTGGDNLWHIARKLHPNDSKNNAKIAKYVDELIKLNRDKIKNPNLIRPGLVLKLPPVAEAAKPAPTDKLPPTTPSNEAVEPAQTDQTHPTTPPTEAVEPAPTDKLPPTTPSNEAVEPAQTDQTHPTTSVAQNSETPVLRATIDNSAEGSSILTRDRKFGLNTGDFDSGEFNTNPQSLVDDTSQTNPDIQTS